MVEFAVIGGFLMLILIGIMEFGLAVLAKNTVTAAAREGARFAIVWGTESGATTNSAAVATYVEGRTALSPITVVTTWDDPATVAANDGTKDPGMVVQVKVDYNYQPIGPVVPSMVLTSTSRMVISY